MAVRGISRFPIAIGASIIAHLAVLFIFSRPGVGHVPGKQVELQIYLPAAASPAYRTMGSSAEGTDQQDVGISPRPMQPSVEREIPSLRKTEPSILVPQNAALTTVGVTAASAARPETPNESPIATGPVGGVPNGGQLKRVSIDFDVLSGPEKRLVSRGRHVYVAEREFFGISVSDVPLDGQVSKDSWRIEISGRVSLQGLSPILYETRGALPRDLMALSDSSVDKHAPNQALQKKWQIADGLLDRQSLLYHFMFKPPELTGGNVWLSDGSSHALYTYRMGGTEALPIAGMGNVSTLKLVFTTSASQERIELWLLPDRHYLPLKARYTDGQGAITEQTATSIDYE